MPRKCVTKRCKQPGGRRGVLIMVTECVPREIRQEEADLFICNLFNDPVNKNKEGRRRN